MASVGVAAAGLRAGVAGLGALALAKLTGSTSAPADAASPHGYVLHFLDDDNAKSRNELMVEALQALRASRDDDTAKTAEGKRRQRTATANDTWLKIYAIIDYVRPAPLSERT
jgi:predicted peptidase